MSKFKGRGPRPHQVPEENQIIVTVFTLCLVTQLCPTLCNPIDWSLPGSSIHGDSPGKNTGVGCHALLQGIFPTQGWNSGLPYCWQILYCLIHHFYSTTNQITINFILSIIFLNYYYLEILLKYL